VGNGCVQAVKCIGRVRMDRGDEAEALSMRRDDLARVAVGHVKGGGVGLRRAVVGMGIVEGEEQPARTGREVVRQRNQALDVLAIDGVGVTVHARRIQDRLAPQHLYRPPPLVHAWMHGAARAAVSCAQQMRMHVPQRTRVEAIECPAHEIVLRQRLGQLAAARVVDAGQGGVCLQRREQPGHGGGAAAQHVAAVEEIAIVGGVWHQRVAGVDQNAMLRARG
jgi:hypothetical protein